MQRQAASAMQFVALPAKSNLFYSQRLQFLAAVRGSHQRNTQAQQAQQLKWCCNGYSSAPNINNTANMSEKQKFEAMINNPVSKKFIAAIQKQKQDFIEKLKQRAPLSE